ncbi:MAG: PKD domain-containing protein, partial [Methanobacteriota archaeon]
MTGLVAGGSRGRVLGSAIGCGSPQERTLKNPQKPRSTQGNTRRGVHEARRGAVIEVPRGRGPWRVHRVAISLLAIVVLALTAFSARADPHADVVANASLDPAGSVTSTDVLVGDSVGFYGSSSSGPSPLQYTWYFRDGETSTLADATHAFRSPGSYEVALVVRDAWGRMDLDRVTVNVRQPLPGIDFIGADAGPNRAVDEDQAIPFDASHSMESWPHTTDAATLRLEWDFGDGTSGARTNEAHAYANAGTYLVRLTVTDPATGAFGADTAVVSVTNVPPVADAGPPFRTVWEDDAMTFDARESTDTPSDLTDLAYAWDFGDGSRGSGAVVTHAYANEGTYLLRLKVTDDNAAWSTAEVSVNVLNRPPTADAGADITVLEGNPAFFDGRASTDTVSDTPVLTYAWTPDPGVAPLPGWGPTYTWFDDRGPDLARDSVALLVADDDGASSTATTNVTVVNVPPRVGITGVWWFSDKILFEGTAFDPGADDLTFIWKVGGVSGSDWYRSTSFANGLHPREQVAYASYPTGPRLNALLPLTFALVVNDDEGAGGFDTVTLVSSKTSAFPAPLCAIPPDVAVQCALPPRDDRLVDGLAPRFDAGPAVTVSEEAVSPTFAPSSFADSSSASWTLVWEWGDGSVTQLNGVVDPVHTYVEHPFAKAGTYTVALTIIGNGGLTMDGFLATVENVAPVADFSVPAEPREDEGLDVSGLLSTDTASDKADLRYLWT